MKMTSVILLLALCALTLSSMVEEKRFKSPFLYHPRWYRVQKPSFNKVRRSGLGMGGGGNEDGSHVFSKFRPGFYPGGNWI